MVHASYALNSLFVLKFSDAEIVRYFLFAELFISFCIYRYIYGGVIVLIGFRT